MERCSEALVSFVKGLSVRKPCYFVHSWMESCTCDERPRHVHSDHWLGSISADKRSKWPAPFDRAVSAEAVGRYHSLAWGSSSIARASPTVYRRARQRPIFHDYMQTTPLFAVFSGHSRGKKGFCHDKQHWKGVFCVHCGELLFFTEGRRAQLQRFAAVEGLIDCTNID